MRDDIESVLGKFAPYHGWHDDHAGKVGVEYLPAIQQVRAEFYALLDEIIGKGFSGGRCLQLGLGISGASHAVWQCLFARVLTIDSAKCLDNDLESSGCNTDSTGALWFAGSAAPYDFLFIDAGHLYDEVKRDYRYYENMVRPGGIIAFHDAVQRVPGIEVWKFLEELGREQDLTFVGTDIGTAWLIKK